VQFQKATTTVEKQNERKFVHVYDSVIKGGEKRKGRRKGKGERERKDEKEERERRKATIGINNSILVTPQLVAAAAAVAL
jgi:hypothetical protein